MSLCHPSKSCFSCGACCGILNFKLPKTQIEEIILERTEQFDLEVNFKEKWTIAKFRKNREEKEKKYIVLDETVYICPFLGKRNKKLACMIHPSFTKDARSQNFSFYGSSICLGYECVNLKRKTSKLWEHFFETLNINSLDYCGIAADYKLIDLIEAFFNSKDILITSSFFTKYKKVLKLMFLHKIKQKINMGLTSFEIYTEAKEEPFDKLIQYLNLELNSTLYNSLKNIK